MKTRHVMIALLALVGGLGLGFGAVLLGARASGVDWTRARAVVLESDDWGFCGFVPDRAAWAAGGERTASESRYPPVYEASTLEDSTAVVELCAVLAAHRGADRLPAVLQPNYIVAALSCEPLAATDRSGGRLWRRIDEHDGWFRYELPELPPQYRRPGLLPAVRAAIRAGLWYPEYHGSYHYDPQRRHEAVAGDPTLRAAARRGVLPFPGDSKAWELGPWRASAELEAELAAGLMVFTRLFGRKPSAVVAPDYTWDERCEQIWARHGLTVIQGKREQRHPDYFGRHGTARVRKLLARTVDRLRHRDRVYLERNCRLEPVQAVPGAPTTADCVAQVRAAWRRGEPAVVETHRVNYVHLDPAVRRLGLAALDRVLAALAEDTDGLPLFITDHELAQLDRGGTSWCVRGRRLVVRNLTRSRRVVAVPVSEFARAGAPVDAVAGETSVLVAVRAGQNLIFGPW